ncbi:MAG: alcohol dehydrogenase [Candidatus Scalindua sp. AMX11]|nr:MAG: alcohol dehydrogenase [Candidatus Scalindua sp.]NOG83049.1 zinc-dependent alcohol dehydrogenase family protein [Planctomycetota bacterium]RZV79553.1 MAG: alcohol dehydrogenase [Candidatus Scalindua sp. SCAELEC01]TDE65192.1 MAG: alcohol dehydrogenase [Candidatus Scalindua sp. AMX11]GJQ58573.1 MAG: alcohol dehydrogenase [Candidatus Scalindua sp.]
MKAMILKKIGSLAENRNPLEFMNLPDPVPRENEILVRVLTCGVCHTELDEIEGRTPPPNLPVILGHQVVGRVEQTGSEVSMFKSGDRVGIGWIYSSCERCEFCLEGNENLCQEFQATGRDVNGGYAEYMTVPEGSAFRIPDLFSDSEAAPLLCAGAIGYRSLRLTGLTNGQNLGLTGFGASAHLVLQMVRYRFPHSKIFVFARSESERVFARELGAVWSGAAEEVSPEKLDAIIDTTPAWKPIVEAMKNLKPGGRLVINAIRKEERDKESLMGLDYPTHLWLEKEIKSVANVSRGDIGGFLVLGAKISIKPEVQEFSLEEANVALSELKAKKIRGAKVLVISG